MSEKRFTNVGGVEEFVHLVFDNETARTLSVKQTVKKLNEQSDTISKLQDLCGQSDGENARLRIVNKNLKDDLHNCRLNKNIIREKLKLWQDVHKEYGIYSIKDFEELMKNDK